MTIFFEVFRHFLIERITQIRDRSSTADHSLGNNILSTMSFGHFGRDRHLSQIKRNLADQLILEIRAIDGEEKDDDNLDCFNTLITSYKEKAAEESKKRGYPEGEFGAAMDDNLVFLNKICKKMRRLNLLDIPHDDDPLHIFYFRAALYFGEKLNDLAKQQPLEKLIQHPRLTAFAKLTEAKSELLIKTLQTCTHDLETLDMSHPDYKETRKARVLESLNKLEQGNKQLCKEFSKFAKIPITVAWFSTFTTKFPAIIPDDGLLGDCVEGTKKDLKNVTECSGDLALSS